MTENQTQADKWYKKLMKTEVSQQSLLTYRFEKWQYYKRLVREEKMKRMWGENRANVQ